MNPRLLVKLLLLLSMQYIQTSGGSEVTIRHDDNVPTSKVILENLTDGRSLKVESEIRIDILMGKTTELHCGNKTHTGMVPWWQTPFGSFRDRRCSNKDPFEVVNGNLRILKTTSSHTGLYHCHLVDSGGTTIIPYKVKVVDGNIHKTKTRTSMRSIREVETNSELSDSHFAAAVSLSVVITFTAAFILGAFSQPHVIRCLRRTRGRMFPKRDDMLKVGTNKQSRLNVVFHRKPNLEDMVDFEESSTNVKTEPDNQDGSTDTEHEIHKQSEELGDEADQENQQARKQPRQVSRVIKLYNYDEDGNRYGHINEPETEATPRQRVMSLTRLESIMNQVQSPDFSTGMDRGEQEEPAKMYLEE